MDSSSKTRFRGSERRHCSPMSSQFGAMLLQLIAEVITSVATTCIIRLYVMLPSATIERITRISQRHSTANSCWTNERKVQSRRHVNWTGSPKSSTSTSGCTRQRTYATNLGRTWVTCCQPQPSFHIRYHSQAYSRLTSHRLYSLHGRQMAQATAHSKWVHLLAQWMHCKQVFGICMHFHLFRPVLLWWCDVCYY